MSYGAAAAAADVDNAKQSSTDGEAHLSLRGLPPPRRSIFHVTEPHLTSGVTRSKKMGGIWAKSSGLKATRGM